MDDPQVDDPDGTDVARRTTELRLAAMADEHRVAEVLGAFAEARDAHLVESALACCTDDVRITVGEPANRLFAGVEGVDGLARAWADEVRRVPFLMQFRSDLRVSVRGDQAVADCIVLAPTTMVSPSGSGGDPTALWLSGREVWELVRAPGGWRIASLHVEPDLAAPYDEGWGVRRFVA